MRPLVLIAEDEPNIVESLTFLVERAGFAVVSVQDGATALQSIQNLRPALVVLDVMLPMVNGFEVLQSVKGSPDLKDIPILVLTARGQEVDRQRAEALGADAFISKPFSNRDVVQRVCELSGGAPESEHGDAR